MNLLNPFFLLGGLALSIPVLIHLVRKEKTEIIPFSSLMFLLRVPKSSIRQQKIKNLLLMALRLLLLALLVGAFTRPYFTQPETPIATTSNNQRDRSVARQFLQHAVRRQLQQIDGGSKQTRRRDGSWRSHGNHRV
jgi:hypothetical protein